MWKTNVFIAYDGNEKRESIRQFPRLSYLYTIPINAEFKRSHIYHSIYKGLALNDWLIPMWWEMQKVSIAGSVITVDARPWPLAVGDRLFTVDFVRHHSFSVNEITAITDTSITVSGTIPDMRLPRSMPIRVGYIDNRASLQTLGGFIGDAQILFTLSEPVRLATDEIVGTGAPVYNEPYLSSGRVSKQISQTISTVDYGRLVARRERWDAPKAYYEMGFRQHNLCDHAGFRKFLYQQRGRERPFWLPSFETDLVPVRDSTAIGTTLKVRDYSYNDTDMHRNCIAIKDVKGNWHYRKITANDTTAGVISLTLDTALALRHEQINYISYLGKHRITSDRIQIDHGQAVVKECSLRVAEIEACGDETSWYSRVITTGCHARALPPEGSFSDTSPIPPFPNDSSGGDGGGGNGDEDDDGEVGPLDVIPVVFPNPTIEVNGVERDDFFAPETDYELASFNNNYQALHLLYGSNTEAVYQFGHISGQTIGEVHQVGIARFYPFAYWSQGGGLRVWYLVTSYNVGRWIGSSGGVVSAYGRTQLDNMGGDDPFVITVRPPPRNQPAIDHVFNNGEIGAQAVASNPSLSNKVVYVGAPLANIPFDRIGAGTPFTYTSDYSGYLITAVGDESFDFGALADTFNIVNGVLYFAVSDTSLSTHTYRVLTLSSGSATQRSAPITFRDVGNASLKMLGTASAYVGVDTGQDGTEARMKFWNEQGGDPTSTIDLLTDPVGPVRGDNTELASAYTPLRGNIESFGVGDGKAFLLRSYGINRQGGALDQARGFTCWAGYTRVGGRVPQSDLPHVWYRPTTS